MGKTPSAVALRYIILRPVCLDVNDDTGKGNQSEDCSIGSMPELSVIFKHIYLSIRA
jgi:hypothetical protein